MKKMICCLLAVLMLLFCSFAVLADENQTVVIFYYLKDVPAGAVELTEDLAAALESDIYAQRTDSKMELRLAELKEASEIVYSENF